MGTDVDVAIYIADMNVWLLLIMFDKEEGAMFRTIFHKFAHNKLVIITNSNK